QQIRVGLIDHHFGLGDIHSDYRTRDTHCHKESSGLGFKGLSGPHHCAGLLLSSVMADAFLIGALVKGWGEVSHGLYWLESDAGF
ncbi:hypothetical protein SOP85_14070, partial [Pseudomonas sp. YuFO20]|nr:hypothetical protein [Pseudomonas sp. YuFO20]